MVVILGFDSIKLDGSNIMCRLDEMDHLVAYTYPDDAINPIGNLSYIAIVHHDGVSCHHVYSIPYLLIVYHSFCLSAS